MDRKTNIHSIGNCASKESQWKNIEIDGTDYIVRAIQKDDTWKILLSDLIEIYVEILTNEQALTRCQELNPLLDTDFFDANRMIHDILNDIPEHAVYKSVYRMRLKMNKEGGILEYILNFNKGTPQQLWEEITKPMYRASMEIYRRNSILLDLVKRKDEEIAEYKAEGAELLRKYIVTEPFHENMFERKSPENDSIYFGVLQIMMDVNREIDSRESLMRGKRESSLDNAEPKPETGLEREEVEDAGEASVEQECRESPVQNVDIANDPETEPVPETKVSDVALHNTSEVKSEDGTSSRTESICDRETVNIESKTNVSALKKKLKRPKKSIHDFI